ncbi:type VI immunity family protein [Nitratireductor sp. ZSWI3]|uniref:type VI immunity family protein n=1 Tax=Nitratireductor sp. ZSWI3 TaxID=2966359 RepID=UPI00215017B2|nr:type VI immunity family protein [Nitratireductor sp. ZSWI3]MCR4266330.1 DUF3396 domain-containing protein [Nitratireductor sp. ZSWI3]
MVDFLIYEGEPIAVPAFRVIAILAGEIHAAKNKPALAGTYELFEASFGEAANVTSYNFPGHAGKIRWMNPTLQKQGRQFFDSNATEYGQGLRRYGYALDAFEEPALPYFAVEQRSDVCFLEIDIRDDAALAVAFADDITRLLMDAQVIWGVMGMGMFLPPYKSSLEFKLGEGVRRYRTSIEISPSMVMDGIRREGSSHRWQKDEKPGIADIGWRTLIGREYWSRIPDAIPALREAENISVEQSEHVLAITAGVQPIWGDVNRGEDITAYSTVAKQLAPIRYPESAAKAFMFGGNTHDPHHADKIETYLARLL